MRKPFSCFSLYLVLGLLTIQSQCDILQKCPKLFRPSGIHFTKVGAFDLKENKPNTTNDILKFAYKAFGHPKENPSELTTYTILVEFTQICHTPQVLQYIHGTSNIGIPLISPIASFTSSECSTQPACIHIFPDSGTPLPILRNIPVTDLDTSFKQIMPQIEYISNINIHIPNLFQRIFYHPEFKKTTILCTSSFQSSIGGYFIPPGANAIQNSLSVMSNSVADTYRKLLMKTVFTERKEERVVFDRLAYVLSKGVSTSFNDAGVLADHYRTKYRDDKVLQENLYMLNIATPKPSIEYKAFPEWIMEFFYRLKFIVPYSFHESLMMNVDPFFNDFKFLSVNIVELCRYHLTSIVKSLEKMDFEFNFKSTLLSLSSLENIIYSSGEYFPKEEVEENVSEKNDMNFYHPDRVKRCNLVGSMRTERRNYENDMGECTRGYFLIHLKLLIHEFAIAISDKIISNDMSLDENVNTAMNAPGVSSTKRSRLMLTHYFPYTPIDEATRRLSEVQKYFIQQYIPLLIRIEKDCENIREIQASKGMDRRYTYRVLEKAHPEELCDSVQDEAFQPYLLELPTEYQLIKKMSIQHKVFSVIKNINVILEIMSEETMNVLTNVPGDENPYLNTVPVEPAPYVESIKYGVWDTLMQVEKSIEFLSFVEHETERLSIEKTCELKAYCMSSVENEYLYHHPLSLREVDTTLKTKFLSRGKKENLLKSSRNVINAIRFDMTRRSSIDRYSRFHNLLSFFTYYYMDDIRQSTNPVITHNFEKVMDYYFFFITPQSLIRKHAERLEDSELGKISEKYEVNSFLLSMLVNIKQKLAVLKDYRRRIQNPEPVVGVTKEIAPPNGNLLSTPPASSDVSLSAISSALSRFRDNILQFKEVILEVCTKIQEI